VIEALWEADRFRPGEGLVGQVAKDGKPLWTPDLTDEESFLDPAVGDAGFGSMVCVPLIAPGQVVGVLCLAFQGERAIDEREISLLEAVGAGVGIAVENARLNRRTRRLAVLEERERIGMDLHDGIIQSVYAVGLTLEYIRLQIEEDPEQAIQRLEQAIEGLDAVIGDLRSYILDLQPSRIQVDDLHGALERLIQEFKSNTLVDAELLTEPEALEQLERDTASELFLIAQEALANTAKHAFATKVWLTVRQLDEEVSLQVIDNGRGFDLSIEPGRLGHGLSNMSERARQIGGRFEIVSNPGDGTTVTVRMPMDHDSRESQSPSSSTSVSTHVN
jgi:signal transduction histidine kinase